MENNPLEKTIETLGKDISLLKRDAAQIATDVKDLAGAHLDATKQRLAEKVQAAREAVSARPFTILLVGFIIGYLAGTRKKR